MRYRKAILLIFVTSFVIAGLFLQSPVIAHPAQQDALIAEFSTGGDDLRGGNDNLNLILVPRVGSPIEFPNLNGGQKWDNNSTHTVTRFLPVGFSWGNIIGFRLETTFSGGPGGDNWNLNRMVVTERIGGQDHRIQMQGKPLFRFTGDNRVLEILANF